MLASSTSSSVLFAGPPFSSVFLLPSSLFSLYSPLAFLPLFLLFFFSLLPSFLMCFVVLSILPRFCVSCWSWLPCFIYLTVAGYVWLFLLIVAQEVGPSEPIVGEGACSTAGCWGHYDFSSQSYRSHVIWCPPSIVARVLPNFNVTNPPWGFNLTIARYSTHFQSSVKSQLNSFQIQSRQWCPAKLEGWQATISAWR